MRHGVGWDLAGFSFRRLRRSQFESLSLGRLEGGKRIYVFEDLVQVVGEVLGLRVGESESGQSRNLEDLFACDRHGGLPVSQNRGEGRRTGPGAASFRRYRSGP